MAYTGLLQPFRQINLFQVCPNHRNPVVILPCRVTLQREVRIAVYRLLERGAYILASRFQVTVDDDNFRLAVGTQHVVEECVAAMQGVTKDEDTFGMSQYFCCAIPRGDILS